MPGLKKELKGLGLRGRMPTKMQLHYALDTAALVVPRYLFRMWDNNSGGDSRLNSVDAITPLAFLTDKNSPKNIFDMDVGTLHGLICGHLNGRYVKTVFSSWSHSLPFVLSIAAARPGAYLGVIDTHQLQPHNYIFHCGANELGSVGIPSFDHEFLLYGVVEGKAHCAKPLHEVRPLMPWITGLDMEWSGIESAYCLRPLLPEGALEPSDRLKRAKAFGRLFGPGFELPMAIYFLTMPRDITNDAELLGGLIDDLRLPSSWQHDTAFPMMARDTHGHARESTNASHAMIAIAIAERLRGTARAPMVNEEGSKTAEHRRKQDEPGRNGDQNGEGRNEPSVHLRKTAGMPRAIYDLYIDMVGYDEPNSTVR